MCYKFSRNPLWRCGFIDKYQFTGPICWKVRIFLRQVNILAFLGNISQNYGTRLVFFAAENCIFSSISVTVKWTIYVKANNQTKCFYFKILILTYYSTQNKLIGLTSTNLPFPYFSFLYTTLYSYAWWISEKHRHFRNWHLLSLRITNKILLNQR